MDEVRDVGPEGLVARAEPDRRARGSRPAPTSRARTSCSAVSSPLRALEMDLALEGVEGDLAHDRVDHVLDLRGEHRLALDRVGGLLEEAAEGQHLAEHARGLGERQRRRRHERAVRRREHLVHAVAELVRERHHVPRLALVVEEHIGVRRRHRRMREGAGRLAGPDRRVDPALVEESLGDLGHARREAGIGCRAPCRAPRSTGWCAARPSAAARCGPNARAGPCRTSAP